MASEHQDRGARVVELDDDIRGFKPFEYQFAFFTKSISLEEALSIWPSKEKEESSNAK